MTWGRLPLSIAQPYSKGLDQALGTEMHVFAVYHEGGRPKDVQLAIESHFGTDDVSVLSSDLLLLRSQTGDPRLLAEHVMIQEGDQPGVIFKLNASHSGYYRQEFWKWLQEAREA